MYSDFSIAALNFICLVLGIGSPQNFPPPLSSQKEHELFLKMKNEKSGSARTSLIEHNLRLVAHIVRKYYTVNKSSDDLISVGTIGLVKAVDTFNNSNGTRFATYAAKCIQNDQGV